MAKMNPAKKKAFLARMAAGRRKAAGRVVGRKVKRKRAGAAGAAGAGMVHAGALPARKGHPRGKIGGGSHSVRMTRIETAVVDLARANHAIVSKVVDHEKRLNRVESTLSTWAKGRR